MSFKNVTQAAQRFAESDGMFGESFTYQNVALRGVFDQQMIDWEFGEFSFRKVVALICVTSKAQWANANITPANRMAITYGGNDYPIQTISGLDSDKEPTFTLTCFRNT